MTSIMDVAIKFLSDHNCSEQELKNRLEKEFAEKPDVEVKVESALVRLRELHLINDNRLAESLSLRYSHKGNRFISQALRQKGVDDDVIAQTLALLPDEFSRAFDEARRKIGHKRTDNPEKIKTQLFRFLSGRGFSYDTINAVVRQLDEEGFFRTLENDTMSFI